MDRTRKATWGVLSGLAFAGTTVVIGLTATPLLLKWLGPERFGAFRAAGDWTGHLTILELGLSWALIPLFARALGRHDIGAVRAILRQGVRVYLGVALLMLMAGIGLALAIGRLVPVNPSAAGDLQRGCWIGLLSILVVPLTPFRALAEADQRNYLINALLITQTLLVAGLGLLLAWAGWGITGQFLAASLGLYPLLLLLMWDGLQRYSSLRLAPEAPCKTPDDSDAKRQAAEVRREIWKLNWPSLIRNTCGRIGLFTDNLLVAYFLGPAIVASFYLTQRTCVLAQSQLLGIGSSGWAGLVELIHKGQIATFHRRLTELTGLVTVLGIAVMVPLAALNGDFVSLWVGPACFGGEWITGLAAINGILLSIFSLWGLVISGAGHVARVVPGTVASATVNIVVSIVATIILGPSGPLLGTLTALLTVNSWFFPRLLRQLFQVPLKPLLTAILFPVLIGIPYAIGVRWFAQAHPAPGWVGLSLEMAVSALIYLALAWLAVFNANERAVWLFRFRLFLSPRAAI